MLYRPDEESKHSPLSAQSQRNDASSIDSRLQNRNAPHHSRSQQQQKAQHSSLKAHASHGAHHQPHGNPPLSVSAKRDPRAKSEKDGTAKSSESRQTRLGGKQAFTASFGSIQQGALHRDEYIHFLKEQLRTGNYATEGAEHKSQKHLLPSSSSKITKSTGSKITSAFANYNKLVRRFQKSAMQLQKVPNTSQRTREYRMLFYSGTGENKGEKNNSAYGAHSSSSIEKTFGPKMVGSKSSNTSGTVRTKSPGVKASPGGVGKKSVGA